MLQRLHNLDSSTLEAQSQKDTVERTRFKTGSFL